GPGRTAGDDPLRPDLRRRAVPPIHARPGLRLPRGRDSRRGRPGRRRRDAGTTPMRSWWDARSRREQVLLGVMAVGVAGFLLWFALLAPLAGARRAADARYAAAVEADVAV